MLEKIKKKKAKVCIIGLGYVGLPLAKAVANSGFPVHGIDLAKKKVQLLSQHHSYIPAVSSKELSNMLNSGLFTFGSDYQAVNDCDIVIICVPTPLSRNGEPDLSFVESVTKSVAKYMKKDSLVVLESTTYPGTTEELLKPILDNSSLSVGRDYYLAYSPEREDPGNKEFCTSTIPKVVGGYCEESTKFASAFYSQVVSSTYSVSSATVAEAVKLYENTYRLINISWVNEMKIIFQEMGIDIWEVIEAAKSKPFGFTPFYPGPGIGGHCIPIDPYYLTWKAREFGISTRFIETSRDIRNIGFSYIINKIRQILDDKYQRGLNGSKILLLGLSYKKDIGDERESPALEIFDKLSEKNSVVDYFDPHVPETSISNKKVKSLQWDAIDFSKYHAVILLTDHSGIDYEKILNESRLFIDTKNVFNGNKENVIRV